MTDLHIELTIISATAVSVGAGGSAGTLADKSIVRDGWDRPIIPGSQVKGKARWAAEQLLRGLGWDVPAPFDERERVEIERLKRLSDSENGELVNSVRALFGSPEQRSPLYFADLPSVIGATGRMEALRNNPEQHRSQIRPSVAINRRRGVAEDARLLFQETALEGTRFHAKEAIIGQVPDSAYAALLWAVLNLTNRWGGAKSRGLGWSSVAATVFLDGSKVDEPALRDYLRQLLQTTGGG